MSDVSDQFIRVPQAAILIGCCARIVWELLATGVLTRYKLPDRRVTVLSKREVLAYVERVKGGQDAAVS